MLNKVLISGIQGFIGKHLELKLQQLGISVCGISRSSGSENKHIFQINLACDKLPENLCTGVDTVFHLAGKAHALAETHQDAAEYNQINTEGTRKLLEAAQQAGVTRFVFFSSVKAVADNPDAEIDETYNIAADTPYGLSKYAAEQLVLYGGYVPHPVVIRPCMVYGNTQKGNLPKMIKAVRKGLFPPLPAFNNRRSMVHVSDVVSAAILAAEIPAAAGQTYIVSDGQSYASREIYDWIRSELGKPPAAWIIPVSVLETLAKIGDGIGHIHGKRFIFDSEALRKLSSSACYSSAKINRELGFQAQFTLQQALPEIIRYLN